MRDAIDLNLEAIRPPFVPFEHKSIRVLSEKRMEKRKDIYIRYYVYSIVSAINQFSQGRV